MNHDHEKQILLDTVHEYFFNQQASDNERLVAEDVIGDKVTKRYRVREELKKISDELANLGLNIAGGACLSSFTAQRINDLDFYIERESDLEQAKELFKRYFGEPTFISRNAISYARNGYGRRVYKAQLITRFTGRLQEIFDWFDFTITQSGFSFKDQAFHFGERFFSDVSRRRLVYLGKSKYPICALYRTRKYQERGYSCPGSTLMHIALSIVRLEIKSYKELKEQLMGVDTAYLAGLLDDYSKKGMDDIPVNYGEFLEEVFARIDGVVPETTTTSYLSMYTPAAIRTEEMFNDSDLEMIEEGTLNSTVEYKERE